MHLKTRKQTREMELSPWTFTEPWSGQQLNSVAQTPWAHNLRWWWVLWQSHWNTEYGREGLLPLTWMKRKHWKTSCLKYVSIGNSAVKSQQQNLREKAVLLRWSSPRQERHQPQCHYWIHRFQLSKISKSNYKQEMPATGKWCRSTAGEASAGSELLMKLGVDPSLK